MQFRVAVEDFLRFCRLERQLSAHSVQAYTADLVDLRRWLARDLAISEISTAALKAYLEHLVGERKLAVATVRRRFACLRSFFRRTATLGLGADPFLNWRPVLPRRKRLPRTLSRAEAAFLIAPGVSGLVTPREGDAAFRTILRLMVATGMRVGEVCKLRIEDLSPDCTTLRIQGKGARDRVAYVTDQGLRQDLRRLLDWRRQLSSAGALFLNRHGAPLKPQSIRARLRRHAAQAGFSRRVTPHMLRHTAATLLIETGVDIRFVQRLLGHSSIATTEIYTHVSDEALRTTLERANVLGGLASP